MTTLTISEVARSISHRYEVTVPPHVISTLFYKRHLDDGRCPIVGRTRLIPEDYVPVIEQALRERGLLRARTQGTSAWRR